MQLASNLTMTVGLFPPKRRTIRKKYFVSQVPKACDPILFWLERQTNNLNCSTQRIMTLFSRQNQVVMTASLSLWARALFSVRIEYWCIPLTKRALRQRQYGICVPKTSFRPLIEGQNALAPKLVLCVSRDISEWSDGRSKRTWWDLAFYPFN